MRKETDDSILMEGIYYTNFKGKITDLYHIKYNPDNPDLFDIDALMDNGINTQYNKEYLINMLKQNKYFNPFTRQAICYKERKNIDILIDTIHRFYSNITCGVRQINPTPSNTSSSTLGSTKR